MHLTVTSVSFELVVTNYCPTDTLSISTDTLSSVLTPITYELYEVAQVNNWSDIDAISSNGYTDCAYTWTLTDDLDVALDSTVFTIDMASIPFSLTIQSSDFAKAGTYNYKLSVS